MNKKSIINFVLRMIATAIPEQKQQARKHWNEAKELNLILNAIFIKVK